MPPRDCKRRLEDNGNGVWERIETAPFDRDLELAVIEGGSIHQLVFPCRRVLGGWTKAKTGERVAVQPTHWRAWIDRATFRSRIPTP